MTFQSVVDDVKGRVELLSTRSQKVAEISLDSLKQAGDIVVETVQTLINDNTNAAKDIYSSAKSGFDKARVDGFKAVASNPISYLPPSDKLVAPFNNAVSVFSKTGDELYQVAKTSFSSIQAQITGETPVAKTVKAAKTTAKKATAAAKKTAKAVAAAAE